MIALLLAGVVAAAPQLLPLPKPEPTPAPAAVSDCQPRLFNPGRTKTVPDSVRSIDLSKPYSAHLYGFACPSKTDYVLEIRKNSNRLFLFTHVYKYDFSADGRYLYLHNNVEVAEGKWQPRHRIIDLVEKRKRTLPQVDCLSGGAKWSEQRLISWGGEQSASRQIACVFNRQTAPLARVQFQACWSATGANRLATELHLSGDEFYAKNPERAIDPCPSPGKTQVVSLWPVSAGPLLLPLPEANPMLAPVDREDCQPRLFNPGKTAVVPDGKHAIELPEPYSATAYEFGCRSSADYVLEIQKSGARLFLFTHVYQYEFSPEGRYLYLFNKVHRGDDTWHLSHRIVDLVTEEKRALPMVECLGGSAKWSETRLVSWGNAAIACVFDTNAAPVGRVRFEGCWHMGGPQGLATYLSLAGEDLYAINPDKAASGEPCPYPEKAQVVSMTGGPVRILER